MSLPKEAVMDWRFDGNNWSINSAVLTNLVYRITITRHGFFNCKYSDPELIPKGGPLHFESLHKAMQWCETRDKARLGDKWRENTMAFLKRLIHPDEFGHAVTAEVRDAARELLGLERCEHASRATGQNHGHVPALRLDLQPAVALSTGATASREDQQPDVSRVATESAQSG